jgi:hypothetical protein
MDYEKFNKLVNVSMEERGDTNTVLNLGVNGQVSFSVNEEQPWTYTKVVHTDLGSHPVMQSFDDIADVLDLINPYIDDIETHADLGPFIELNMLKVTDQSRIQATARMYVLNVETCELEKAEVFNVA